MPYRVLSPGDSYNYKQHTGIAVYRVYSLYTLVVDAPGGTQGPL